jgi:hypothetical protein
MKLENIRISFWNLDGKNSFNFVVKKVFVADIEHGFGFCADQRKSSSSLK